MIGRPQLKMQFGSIAFVGCRHWDSLELAGLEELIGLAQRILVSPVAGIVEIAGPESDLWAHCGLALGWLGFLGLGTGGPNIQDRVVVWMNPECW